MLVLVSLLWGFSFPVLKAIALIHEQLIPGGGS